MVELALTLLMTASMPYPAATSGLAITTHMAGQGSSKRLVFSITNDSDKPLIFDQAASPRAPYEVALVVFVGEGGIGHVVNRLPVISDTITRNITVGSHRSYKCSIYISEWFHGKIPNGKQAILLWSFKPEKAGVFAKPLYGGAVLLQEEAPQNGKRDN